MNANILEFKILEFKIQEFTYKLKSCEEDILYPEKNKNNS